MSKKSVPSLALFLIGSALQISGVQNPLWALCTFAAAFILLGWPIKDLLEKQSKPRLIYLLIAAYSLVVLLLALSVYALSRDPAQQLSGRIRAWAGKAGYKVHPGEIDYEGGISLIVVDHLGKGISIWRSKEDPTHLTISIPILFTKAQAAKIGSLTPEQEQELKEKLELTTGEDVAFFDNSPTVVYRRLKFKDVNEDRVTKAIEETFSSHYRFHKRFDMFLDRLLILPGRKLESVWERVPD